MAHAYESIDISNAPELQRLAHAVRQSDKSYALKEGAETVAVLRPAPNTEPRTGFPASRQAAPVQPAVHDGRRSLEHRGNCPGRGT
jgi:hypothetical protein